MKSIITGIMYGVMVSITSLIIYELIIMIIFKIF